MSCFGCSRKYGIFCKEYGCPNCGFSYCAKCLKRPVHVPRHRKVLNVCLICYDKLSKTNSTEKIIEHETLCTNIESGAGGAAKISIEDDLFSNAIPENLDQVLKPTIPQTTDNSKSKSTTINSDIIDNLDSEISKRLKELKSDCILSSDDEIRTRLANLNDMKEKNVSNKNILISTDQRSDAEKTNDLLNQFFEETQLNQRIESDRNDAITDIERRLAALRGGNVTDKNVSQSIFTPDTNTPSDNEEYDEIMLKQVIEKYCNEPNPTSIMGDIRKVNDFGTPPPSSDLNELPWCNICNENAVYRCIGCDGELFCNQCYHECHDDDEYRSHKKEPYTEK